MKVVVQRVKSASIKTENYFQNIGKGLLVFVGFTKGDSTEKIDYLAEKIKNLRIFDDKDGIMNLSIRDIAGSILSISQFTLYANTKKGNRPSYIDAMKGEDASLLYDYFNKKLASDVLVRTGVFGSEMMIELINDGPVTIILEY